ncbi:mRNA cap guanine-N7 methyltransferase isoform X2 [Aricia agestis]|uniref:mRNA cap guanine-N7 methyltransferase isoform X2 n=1 Tax=Aricia agestis TaxID=91739 RepID=UPI001C208A0C|nr:mRNA cap guanine-N7 methyltransferase isoform X2 [Aricia agestis]
MNLSKVQNDVEENASTSVSRKRKHQDTIQESQSKEKEGHISVDTIQISDRKHQDTIQESESKVKEGHVSVVAAHYNHLEEKGIHERFNSPIFYLRNINNWVKSVLIQEYIDKIREKDYGRRLRVLDICCGKGGDMGKWQKSRVEHVVFADIAEVSVRQCQERYNDLQKRAGHLFSAEFIAADCTKDTLRDKYKDPSISYDLVSCQFGLHYSFESLTQARRMLTNISECLKPNGYFIGTVPDAYEIVTRCRKSSNNSFGNSIFNIKLLFDPKDGYPLFGGKYDFNLEGVVNCPEFLVNFELLVKLASQYGLELVYKARFADFYREHSSKYKSLLHKIMCLESYPAPPGKTLIAEESDYKHAMEYLEKLEQRTENTHLGTMSLREWEAVTIYVAFAFRKCKNTSWTADGKPLYLKTGHKDESTSKKD